MRKYATITLQFDASDAQAALHSVVMGLPIIKASMEYADELVDPDAQIQALADEVEAEACARRAVQTELDAERAHTAKLLEGLRSTADAYAALKEETAKDANDYDTLAKEYETAFNRLCDCREQVNKLEDELKPFRTLGANPTYRA